ncbi:MAG: GvpL/GvpF family gas vesicle protein [Acidobacteria bacterium]|nr:GvpL/GvpF family gas vesicle protein [Acidobacteriota bacterium]MBV9188066.1 GvpL/GvpF family gas vesicle protein [Acidobacteriota bacterium]
MKLVVIGAHRDRNDIEPLAAAIAVKELWLSGMEVEESQPLGDRDLLLRVAKTRAALLKRATFVAIRYGFTAHGASDALAKCAAHIDRWRRALNDFRNHVEMTLKVAAAAPQARPDRRDFESGAAYIRALHDATRATNVAPEFRKAVDETLAPLAVKHRWSNRDTASLEFAALVKREHVAAINDAGSALKRDFPSVPFLLSGPWPLEVFADDHE